MKALQLVIVAGVLAIFVTWAADVSVPRLEKSIERFIHRTSENLQKALSDIF